MNEKEIILLENIQEYYSIGLESYKKRRYNTATTLFFKALAALCDLFILRKEGIIPSSHSNRFRILEDSYPDKYDMMDRDFPFYQDSYTMKMEKEAAELLKNDVEKLRKVLDI